MWKKTESEHPQPESFVQSNSPVEQIRDRATIGSSIFIKGDVSGDEDLIIQGRIEGKVELRQHNVTVGKSGRVKADITGKVISVEGEVQGNLVADDKIVIRQSGSVRGNIIAPRVSLEDGSKFKGSIDMDSKPADKQRTLQETLPETKPPAAEAPKKLGLDLKVDLTPPRA